MGVTGNNIFAQNRSRIDYSVDFKSQPRDIWGVGYRAGAYGEKGNFVEKRYNVDVRYLYRVLPNTFIGGMLGFDYTKGKKFSDLSYITFDGVQQKTGYTATGIGAIIEYDSRDFIPNPFRGIYISLVETFYPKPMGTAGSRSGAPTSRPTSTSGCGATASWPSTSTVNSTPTVRRGRCLPAWAAVSACAATMRVSIPITA